MPVDMASMAWHALTLLLEPARLGILLIGVIIGLAIGVLPGLNGIVGMAMLIPFTYNMDQHTAMALLLGMAAVITSSDFISAVLFGVPGHVGAAATVIDGHAMARNGEAGRAFGAGFAASLAGGLIGAVVLALSIPILRPVLLAIGSPELLAFSLFGLSMVATLSGRAPLKGLTVAGLGLMISMIGSRSESGTLRWTFDTLYLYDGVPLVPAMLGLFAMPELCELAVARKKIAGDHAANINLSNQWQGVRDVGTHWWLVVRCGILGTALGAIPGIGSAVIDWIAYGYAQRTEKNPETFGSGDVRGVIAPESSNNAKEGGHLVPTIAFGVPAGASMAILLGAFLMHGLTPGPEMLTKQLDVTYTIVWSLTLAHIIGAVICLFACPWLARVSTVRPEILLPIVLSLVFVAAYEGSHAAIGRRPRHRRHLRALSLHFDLTLRPWLAMAPGGLGDPRVGRVGALSAAVRDRKERLRGTTPDRLASAADFGLGGLYDGDHPFHHRGDPAIDRLAGRRKAGAAHRVRHGVDRRHAQSHQRTVRKGIDRSRQRGWRRCGRRTRPDRRQGLRYVRGDDPPPGSDLFRLAGRPSGARRPHRLHSGDCDFHFCLYAFGLQRIAHELGHLCSGDRAAVLGPVSQAAGSGVAAIAAGRLLSGAARGAGLHLIGRQRSDG